MDMDMTMVLTAVAVFAVVALAVVAVMLVVRWRVGEHPDQAADDAGSEAAPPRMAAWSRDREQSLPTAPPSTSSRGDGSQD